jgi:hypothetical protein
MRASTHFLAAVAAIYGRRAMVQESFVAGTKGVSIAMGVEDR